MGRPFFVSSLDQARPGGGGCTHVRGQQWQQGYQMHDFGHGEVLLFYAAECSRG